MRRMLVFVLAGAFALVPAPAGADPDPVDLACATVDALGCTTYYTDADGDGYGEESTAHRSPLAPEGEVTTGGDCDDADPGVHPGAVESYDGRDQDCDGSADEPVVLLSEVMANPAAVPDSAGEYLELRNASDEPVRLTGVEITVGTRTCALDGVLGSGARLVAARSSDTALNGGVPSDVVCTFQLVNSGTAVTLSAATGVLDVVDYTGWTVPTGAALGLREAVTAVAGNDAEDAWCPQTSTLPGGDAGTPGDPNDPC